MRALEETMVVGRGGSGVPAPGTIIGAYQLLALIGQGGIGLVYLAEHIELRRRVALKILRRELASNATAVMRFFGEARVVNEIGHENIVEITDFFAADGTLPSHYIMEYLEGATLFEVMAREQLRIDRVLSIGAQIAGVLAAVHAKQIVHRDLKPENVFLVSDRYRTDFVKLLDFGAAKLSAEIRPDELVTRAGVLLGTPRYMAPEQVLGEAIDHRTDLYALGAVLFEMVAGRPVFPGEELDQLLLRHVREEPIAPSAASLGKESIPRALDALILQCLHKLPEDRPASADEVRGRLLRMLEARRRRRAGPSLMAAGVVLAGGLAALLSRSEPPPPLTIEPIPVRAIAPVVEPERSVVIAPPPKPVRRVRHRKVAPKPRAPISKSQLRNPFE